MKYVSNRSIDPIRDPRIRSAWSENFTNLWSRSGAVLKFLRFTTLFRGSLGPIIPYIFYVFGSSLFQYLRPQLKNGQLTEGGEQL